MTDKSFLEESPAAPRQSPTLTDLLTFMRGPLDIRSLALSGLFVLVLFYSLYLARDVFLPIILALLLSFLLNPVVRGLKKLRVPESLGALLVLVMLVSGVGWGVYWLSAPATTWMAHAPQTLRDLEEKLRYLKQSVDEVSKASKQVEKITQVTDDKATPAVTVDVQRTSWTEYALNVTFDLLATLVVMSILLYFLLASGRLFLLKLVRVLPRLEDKKLAVTIVHQIEEDISRYLLTVTMINSGLGITVGLAMFALGMPNAILWGVMVGALNFIPYLGAMVSTTVLTLVALITFETVEQALVVPIVFVVLTYLEGFFVTPTIVGRRLLLNPVVIFIWLLFWGWLWGIAGALLAVPMLATFKILCDHIEPLAPIGEFLGS